MEPTAKKLPPRKRWLFRLAAVGGAILLLGLVEGLCRWFDWGGRESLPNPFPGFDATEPLFELNAAAGQYEIRAERQKFFVPDSFPARKATNEFRIFCLGGSTVQGRPYSRETAFPTWLRLSLEAASPSRRWTVVNCGGVSYASYRLLPILDECLGYEPDLVVVCTGHNEFLEERSYGRIKALSTPVLRTFAALRKLRLSRLLSRALATSIPSSEGGVDGGGASLPKEVDALLDYRDGIKAYHRDLQWRAGVIAHFSHNLRAMAARAKEARVPLILVAPPSNLKDCPPFKSEHRAGLHEHERLRWQTLTRVARDGSASGPKRAIQALRETLRIDDQYALTHFTLGKLHEGAGRVRLARDRFSKARDLDICPLRILSEMQRIQSEIAEQERIPLLDADALLASECQFGILGDEILLDHVHPSIRGHRLIAGALHDTVAEWARVTPVDGWQPRRDRAYREHLDGLPPLYYTRGLLRLKALQAWTEGRADGPPIESR